MKIVHGQSHSLPVIQEGDVVVSFRRQNVHLEWLTTKRNEPTQEKCRCVFNDSVSRCVCGWGGGGGVRGGGGVTSNMEQFRDVPLE